MNRFYTLLAVLLFAAIGIGITSFVVSRCGWQGLLYGDGALIVAIMECDGD